MGRKRVKPFDRKTDRTTYFRGILYEEDKQHLAFIEKIRNGEVNGYIIHHDKDDSKPHWHFAAHTDNGMTISAFAKSQGIKPNLVQQIDDEEATVAYFEHADNTSKEAGKAPYKIEDGEGKLKNYLVEMRTKMKKRLKRISTYQEQNTMADVLAWIEQQEWINVRDIVKLAIDGGWYDVLRRNWSIIGALCREHNDEYDRKSVFAGSLATDITERLCDTWTRAEGIKMQLIENGVSKKVLERYTADQLAYEASIKQMNDSIKEMLKK